MFQHDGSDGGYVYGICSYLVCGHSTEVCFSFKFETFHPWQGILGVGRVLMGTDISVFDGFDLEGDPDKSDYRNELIAHCGLNMDIFW